MTRAALRAALDLLPRYRDDARRKWPWDVNGPLLRTRAQLTSKAEDKAVTKAIGEAEDAGFFVSKVVRVNVTTKNVWVLHCCLKVSHLYWLARNFDWQRWPKNRLPILVRFKGKLIVWNGTHRMTLCKLTGRKLRARFLDVDAYLRWKEKQRARNRK